MAEAVLHYIYDPLCGWCYGAAPLVEAARSVPGLRLALHGGGMMSGNNRRPITPDWRNYVLPHDARIAQMTGQPFGDGYRDGLLNDLGAMLDSSPPITAILAAEAVEGQGATMLHAVQHAHYVDGLRIAELPVLLALAQQLGLDGAAFEARYAELAGEATARHIADSRALLVQVRGQGFPTFVLDDGSRQLRQIDAGSYLGQPGKLVAMLGSRCDASGCSL
ncbi:DsbA family protein [Janthinobacterium aquaticum]|uniref:DsbA family protein n=1 Tax=Janthinobacterium sp. FT58W TaxID=2654254 RepID=UPI0012648CA7|nr:DsbA family protein [Janthinobacterium sp. FT58W]KAB8043085.1 DsbA family protein [Janthinobacterium sp. FT58W]